MVESSEAGDAQRRGNLPAEERCVDSQTLFQGDRQILIRHGDDVYRLTITRNDKLILQK